MPNRVLRAIVITASLISLCTLRSMVGGVPVADPIAFEALKPRGLQFVTNPGRTARKHQPETMVSGVALFDYNNDGLLDIYVANGATMPGLEKKDPSYYNRLFKNLGDGSFEDVTDKAGLRGKGYNLGVAIGDYDNDGFEDVSAAAGADFARKAIHRGTAFGDIDNDGRVDVVVTALNGPLEVWRNVGPAPNHWILLQLIGAKSNRDGAGAKIRVVTASGARYNQVNTAVGYGCASDRRVHFGLGSNSEIKEIQIKWPSGTAQTLHDVKADQVLTVKEN